MAITHLTQALELCEQLGDKVIQADTLNQLGSAQGLTRDYLAATASHGQALELAAGLGYRLGQANALNLLGAVQLCTGDCQSAAVSSDQALHLYRDIGDREGEAEVLNNLGELALAARIPAEARARYEEALVVADSIPLPVEQARLPVEQARAAEGIGRTYLREGKSALAAAPLQ